MKVQITDELAKQWGCPQYIGRIGYAMSNGVFLAIEHPNPEISAVELDWSDPAPLAGPSTSAYLRETTTRNGKRQQAW